METRGGSGVVYTNESTVTRGMRMENPFSFKVGQVFTGFGIGCGMGIGVGRPLNLGAIPVLNQVMAATRGATDAFSGVQRHANGYLRKVGAKNIEVGIGCGVGFGHGFGVGVAVKPVVLHQIQSQLTQVATHLMMKLGLGPSSTLSDNQGILPVSLRRGTGMVKDPSSEKPAGGINQLAPLVSNSTVSGSMKDGETVISSDDTLALTNASLETQYSRTEAVLNNFLKNPVLKEERSSLLKKVDSPQLENNVIQLVLKHQLLIDELMQENEKLQQILVEELKVDPTKLQSSFRTRNKYPCTECFECRRRQRKR